MNSINSIKIIQPDDWHVHLRENDMMEAVIQYSTRINRRCIVMPNLENPITNKDLASKYLDKIHSLTSGQLFSPLVPCYLIDNLDLEDFKQALIENIFVGAKLYPSNVTTNSSFGISHIENIYPAFEILENLKKPLLIHGEKVVGNIDFFDREKIFIDEELVSIRKKFPKLKIILEHVSSKYGADFVNDNENIAGTLTPQHLMLTKKDVFFDENIDPHHFCMPVVKDENDLLALRKYACSGNKKFFIGTDSAPHHIDLKVPNLNAKPGIFSSPCSIELYASIFDEENSLHNLEKFSSINGPNFYNMSINKDHVELIKELWKVPEHTIYKNLKIKNFMGGKEINWKIKK
jgi:dihydroorotase